MHSTPQALSFSRRSGSLKRATPTTRLPGAARLASRARVGSDLAADAQDDEVARKRCEVRAQHRRRRRHRLLEVLNVAKTFRQRGGRGGHPGVFLERQAVATVSA